jgi:mono/diheme cytochrome c family protein
MRPRVPRLGVQVLITALVAAAGAFAADAPLTGKQLFVRHCARCHTTSGRGLPATHPLLARFKDPPADFGDPLFNSREPAADWARVVKHGGPALGLSPRMPAHGGRMTDAEIQAVVAHLATLADTTGYPPGELNLTRPVRTIKAFPETELLLLGRFEEPEDEAAGSAWRSTVYYARRLSRRWQGEAKLSSLSRGDTADEYEAELGVKWAFHSRGTRLLLAAGTDVEIPLQEGGEAVFVPYLSHAAPLGGNFTLQGTLRTHLPARGLGAGDVELSEIVHWLPTKWRRGAFPGFELTAVAPFDADGRWQVNAIPQLHLALSKRGHVALNVGLELPLLAGSVDYRYRLHTFVLWDMADGGFWKGW